MKPVALGIALIAAAYICIFGVVLSHGLPVGMHLAAVVREDTVVRWDRTPATRAMDSLDSVITERRKK